jgi:hypothetical protein
LVSAPQCHWSHPGSNAAGAVRLLQQEMERQRIVGTVARLIKTELISQLVVPPLGFRKEEGDGCFAGEREMLLLAVYTLCCPCQCAVQVVGLETLVPRCFSSHICSGSGGNRRENIHLNSLPPRYLSARLFHLSILGFIFFLDTIRHRAFMLIHLSTSTCWWCSFVSGYCCFFGF